MCSFASLAVAQVTTSNVRGTVKGAQDGVPMAGVEVKIVEESTGAEKTTTTNDQGEFVFANLQVGGPYHITAELMGFKPAEEKEIFLTANKTRDVALGLSLNEEVIEVSGTSLTRNTSNKTVVTAAEIDSLPSVGRDPRDVVRRNPEASVEGSAHVLTIGGNNNRFNSITVDGTRQDDDFGLTSSGYPTRRSPIALSAVQELTVDSSPFDVHFGKFLGGNVNIVTKSGTNDFAGTLLGTYSSNNLRGSRSRDNHARGDFTEYRYGATLSGPVIKDQVHFLASIEGLSATSPISVGPAGSGEAITTTAVSPDDMQRAIDIARDVYKFNAGVPAGALDEADFKVLGKLDWKIDKENRLSFIYQRTKGNSIQQGNTASATQLPLSSNWYNARDTLNTVSARLFSDWSDRLSTQFEVNAKVVESRVPPVNGNGFMQATITTADRGTIVLGPDRSRHANLLDNDVYHTRGEANYLLGGHLLTAGVEYEQLQIRNLFIQDSNGTATYRSLDDFENMRPSSITYQSSVTLNALDAAANWDLGTWTGYVQDQFKLTSELTVQGGLRTEIYQTSSRSRLNTNFLDRYGIRNDETLTGRSVIMPRLGLSWLPMNNLNVRLGAGLYSGGTPGVWVSNNYTNDGVRTFSANSADPMVVNGFNGRDIPQALKTAVQNGAGNGNVDALDPEFKIPSVWKIGTGADYALSLAGVDGIELRANYTFTSVRDGVMWRDLRRNLDSLPNNTPVGTLPDGRPLYSDTFNPNRGFDMELTNTEHGYGHVLSGVAQKGFSFGLFLGATYAYTINKEVSPGTSSVSTSNYRLAAVVDPNNPAAATSNYERRHRFTETIEFTHPLLSHVTNNSVWKKLTTSLGMFIESRSGQPYSWTFRADDGGNRGGTKLSRIFGEEISIAATNRELAYIPRMDQTCGPPAGGQPITPGCTVILNGVDPAEFNQFLKSSGLDKYRGRITPRNAFTSPWYTRIDARIAQDLPNPLSGNRARFVLDIENVGNLINRKWGRLQAVNFPYATPIVYDVDYDRNNGAYVFSKPAVSRPTNPAVVDITQSVWRLSIGLMYDF
ncbi:MAG TPA: TonB-dependent receptor [Kofleriaceae bacterium]|nr:TonB-dependent receptor [Kofleriaceae bacterium]